jgi:hypothetical protein
MTRYRCYLLDPFGRIRHVEAIDCDDDDQARDRARALLGVHPELRAIQLWDGAREVPIERGAEAAADMRQP